LTVPRFLRPDIDFNSGVNVGRQVTPAFTSTKATLSTGLDQHFSERMVGGVGLSYSRDRLDDDVGIANYSIVALPAYLRHDGANDLLNPTSGVRLGVNTAPKAIVNNGNARFLSSKFSASAYQPFGAGDRFVLAEFAKLGTIVGASRDDLPRDERLYAGGSGSVRGYGFQKAGPLDGNSAPIGGTSSLEAGIELRGKVTDTIGLVGFVEAGSVYSTALPDLGQRLYWGVGIGVRYYSPIGPIRLDLAVPIDRRPSDNAFQIYVSIGQAF
jgi:translocation and assembly module TamA